jgi:hypothetical protein
MEVDILLLFGAKDGSAQPDPAFLEAGERPKNWYWLLGLINTGVLNTLVAGKGMWVEAGLLLKSIRKTPYA